MTAAAGSQTVAAAALLDAAVALQAGGSGGGGLGGGSPFAPTGSSGGGGGGAGGFLQALAIAASFFHSGGVVGRTNVPRRAVPLSAFLDAPRYHQGGVVGLRPNEVPIIGKVGETISPAGQRPSEGDLHVQIQIHNNSDTPVAVDAVEQRRIAQGTRQVLVGLVAEDAARGGDTTRAFETNRLEREGVVI